MKNSRKRVDQKLLGIKDCHILRLLNLVSDFLNKDFRILRLKYLSILNNIAKYIWLPFDVKQSNSDL